jgi:hypothetical protein
MYGVDTSFLNSLGSQQQGVLGIGNSIQSRSRGVLGNIAAGIGVFKSLLPGSGGTSGGRSGSAYQQPRADGTIDY